MAGMTSEILLKRLTKFAIDCQKLSLLLPKTDFNVIYSKQLIRSSSSPAANYIEAIEASSGKDFVHRLKISRKETKESNYWLALIEETNPHNLKVESESEKLIKEGIELIKIFTTSIITWDRNKGINKSKNKMEND